MVLVKNIGNSLIRPLARRASLDFFHVEEPSNSLLINLLAYWKLDEASGTRYDSHGVLNLTDNYSVGSNTAIINSGAIFDGTQNLESDPTGFTISSGLTISFWVKSTLGGIQVGVGFYVGSNAVYVGWLSDGSVFGDLGHGVSNYSNVPNGSLTNDTWTHVVMRADPTAETWTAVVNGNFVVRALPASLGGDSVGSIKVGSNRDGVTSEPMTGMLDEVAIWNRPLTDAEIALLYNNGNGRPYEQFESLPLPPPLQIIDQLVSYWKLDEASGTRYDSHGSLDLTAYNNPLSTTGKISNAARFVAASTQSLRTSQNPFPNNYAATFNVWVKLNYINYYTWIIDTNTGYNWAGGGIGINIINGIIKFQNLYGSDSGVLNLEATTIPQINEWYMLTGSVNAITGIAKLYVNGVLEARSTSLGNGPLFGDRTNPLSLAANADGTFGHSDSIIDEAAVWSRALTNSEVLLLYNNGNGLPYEQF